MKVKITFLFLTMTLFLSGCFLNNPEKLASVSVEDEEKAALSNQDKSEKTVFPEGEAELSQDEDSLEWKIFNDSASNLRLRYPSGLFLAEPSIEVSDCDQNLLARKNMKGTPYSVSVREEGGRYLRFDYIVGIPSSGCALFSVVSPALCGLEDSNEKCTDEGVIIKAADDMADSFSFVR